MKYNCKKIAYIVGTFPCRSETFILREIKYLSDLNFDISVLAAEKHKENNQSDGIKTFYKTSIFSYQVLLSILYCFIKYPLAFPKLFILTIRLIGVCPREAFSLLSNLHTIALFIRYLDKKEISNIHAHFLSWPSIIGLSISIVTRKQFSISAHARDIFVEHGAIALKISHARFITTCTQDGLSYLKSKIAEKYHRKLYLNYHMIKFDEVSFGTKNIYPHDFENIIISVGRLVPKKGFEFLIKAFASISNQIQNCELVIVGEGPEREKYENLIKHYSLEQNVRLTGWQKNEETLKLINNATVLVVPSIIAKDGDRDGIPNVILEAFSCGTPVIASNLNSISEIIEHKKNGLIAEQGNITELASVVKELLTNNNLQKQLAQAAYNTLLECFDPIKNSMKLAKLFQGTNQ